MKVRKKELIIIGVIALLSIGAVLFLYLRKALQKPQDVNMIRVMVGNTVYGEYSLYEDQVIKSNGTNECEIKDGQAVMIHAECPDQLCMTMPAITGKYGLIVCLPNQVIIEGIGDPNAKDDTGVDAVN